MQVEGAVAVVTGGAGGIGTALARRLADAGARVVDFADAEVVATLAFADAAEVEAQHRVTGGAQGARHAVNHLVVHGAAEQRMGMAEQRHGARCVLRRFEQGFEPAGGAVQQEGFDAKRHRV